MKIYVLGLANVHSNVDNVNPVAWSEDKDLLVTWEKEQRAEKPYMSADEHMDGFGQTHGYTLTYKPGSVLEWYNPPESGFGGFAYIDTDEPPYGAFRVLGINL